MIREYFGIRFEFDHQEFGRIIDERVKANEPGYVCAIDGTNFAIAMSDSRHLDVLRESIVNSCDSSWLPILLNRIYGTHFSNYSGSDLFLDLVRKQQYRQFFLGSSRRVLEGLRKEMMKYDSNIGEMRFEELPYCKAEEFDYEGIARMINDDAPDIIWVSLGAPKQEEFMRRLCPHLNKGVMVGIGAVFNFFSGLDDVPKRAPKLMIKLHLEWLDRIFREPRKQIKRCALILKVLPKVYSAEKKKRRSIQNKADVK